MFWLCVFANIYLAVGVVMLIVGSKLFDEGVANLAERSFADKKILLAVVMLIVLALGPILVVVYLPSTLKELLDESRNEESRDVQDRR